MPHDVHWLLLYLVLLVGVESGLRQAADLVLDCWYIEDRGGLGVMGVAFNHEKALLILRNISISGDEETSAWTDYEVQDKDREHIIFEALVSDVPIPDGDALLHADCEGQEVTCDISMLEGPSERHEGEDKPRTTFSGGLRIAGIGLGVSLVFRTIPVTEEEGGERRINERLNVELSTSGTIPLSEPPCAVLKAETLHFEAGVRQDLACEISRYYPLDVSVKWSEESEADDQGPLALPGVSYSSHRRNKDGTYNLSSQVSVTPSLEGTSSVYTCEVTHVALEEPLRVSLRLDAPTGYPIAMPGFIVSSVLFLLTLLYFCRPSQGPSDRTGQRKLS
ncbi:tapasin-related protein-like isoform X2 [Carcharodon carcharias]|uniref:tapasin-related protein-like isoform X2 n=1 Tax=Carcharodon carcharias TaxID=13397 RepID=UPI001B7D9F1A|nr:tapasin-related protein-like isoform X2 [Carcharodon carcharias]